MRSHDGHTALYYAQLHPGGTSAAHAAAAAAERAAAAALSPAVLPAPAGGDDDVTAYDLFGSEDEGDPAPSLANEGAR